MIISSKMEQLYLTARIFNAFAQNIGKKMKNLGHNLRCPKLFWESGIFNPSAPVCYKINRYKRGLETCPQANLHQSGREYFLYFFSDDYQKWKKKCWKLVGEEAWCYKKVTDCRRVVKILFHKDCEWDQFCYLIKKNTFKILKN